MAAGISAQTVLGHLKNALGTSERQTVPAVSPFRVTPTMAEIKDRRRKRRVEVQPFYTSASVRVLARQDGPIDGHIVNLSESGAVVELDDLVAVGQAITMEFMIAGLGRMRAGEWPTYVAAAEVVRIDELEDFPQGPYKTAIRFVRIPTMTQAQIARFIVTQPGKTLV